jgi:hypothetical protein
MSVLVFWVITTCGLVGNHRCFGETHYLQHFNSEDEDSMFLQNVGVYIQDHTALQPRTTSTPTPP